MQASPLRLAHGMHFAVSTIAPAVIALLSKQYVSGSWVNPTASSFSVKLLHFITCVPLDLTAYPSWPNLLLNLCRSHPPITVAQVAELLRLVQELNEEKMLLSAGAGTEITELIAAREELQQARREQFDTESELIKANEKLAAEGDRVAALRKKIAVLERTRQAKPSPLAGRRVGTTAEWATDDVIAAVASSAMPSSAAATNAMTKAQPSMPAHQTLLAVSTLTMAPASAPASATVPASVLTPTSAPVSAPIPAPISTQIPAQVQAQTPSYTEPQTMVQGDAQTPQAEALAPTAEPPPASAAASSAATLQEDMSMSSPLVSRSCLEGRQSTVATEPPVVMPVHESTLLQSQAALTEVAGSVCSCDCSPTPNPHTPSILFL